MMSAVIVIVLIARTAAQFTTNPQSATVNEGQSVTFSCVTSLYDPGQICRMYRFAWQRNGETRQHQYITECNRVNAEYSDRMAVTKTDGLNTLVIQQVRLDDTGEYFCNIYQTRTNILYTSAVANLRVVPAEPVTLNTQSTPITTVAEVTLNTRSTPITTAAEDSSNIGFIVVASLVIVCVLMVTTFLIRCYVKKIRRGKSLIVESISAPTEQNNCNENPDVQVHVYDDIRDEDNGEYLVPTQCTSKTLATDKTEPAYAYAACQF